MTATSVGFLERLTVESDSDSWQRLVDLYSPLIYGWLRRYSVPHQDADDLAQNVLLVVLRELPAFRHNGRVGSFRAWLRKITSNRLRAFWVAQKHRSLPAGGSSFVNMLEQLEDPNSGISRLWNQEHDQYLAERLLQLIEPEFEPSTWRAFCRVVKDGQSAPVAANELGLSVNAVLIAKSRVLKRLREEARDLIEFE